MANTIQVKRSSTPSAVPSSLLLGEIAVNVADNKLWIGTNSGVVQVPLDAVDLPSLQSQINVNKKLDDAIALSVIAL